MRKEPEAVFLSSLLSHTLPTGQWQYNCDTWTLLNLTELPASFHTFLIFCSVFLICRSKHLRSLIKDESWHFSSVMVCTACAHGNPRVFVCDDSPLIVMSCLPYNACSQGIVAECLLIVCLSPSVNETVGRHLFHREDRWPWFTASYRNHPPPSLLWEPIKAQCQFECDMNMHARIYYSGNATTWVLSVTRQCKECETGERNFEKEQIQAAEVTLKQLFRHTPPL